MLNSGLYPQIITGYCTMYFLVQGNQEVNDYNSTILSRDVHAAIWLQTIRCIQGWMARGTECFMNRIPVLSPMPFPSIKLLQEIPLAPGNKIAPGNTPQYYPCGEKYIGIHISSFIFSPVQQILDSSGLFPVSKWYGRESPLCLLPLWHGSGPDQASAHRQFPLFPFLSCWLNPLTRSWNLSYCT